MIDFGQLSLTEAKAYSTSFVENIPKRLEWLGTELFRTNGPAVEDLASGAEGLKPLWEWMVKQINNPNVSSPRGYPPWHVTKVNPYINKYILWLIDAVGIHLGELVRKSASNAEWDVYQVDAKFKDVNQHKTMLHGIRVGPVDPIQMVYGLVIGMQLHGEQYKPDALLQLYNYMTT
jgi:hypothetical protein